MKDGIHPNYVDATITCACGATHVTRSTQGSYSVDICSECHPFYTGRQRMVDTAGRVERFRRKYGKVSSRKAKKAEAGKAEAAKAEAAKKAEAGKAEAKPAEAEQAEPGKAEAEAVAAEAAKAEPTAAS
ncbi:MAG: 50S ribosomal protein L31 [Sandaracinaceae bacterium]